MIAPAARGRSALQHRVPLTPNLRSGKEGDPPTRTMTLLEALHLIGALVTRWLDWLQESSNA